MSTRDVRHLVLLSSYAMELPLGAVEGRKLSHLVQQGPNTSQQHRPRAKLFADVDVKYHFIQELVGRKELVVKFILSYEQCADVITKAFSRSRYSFLRDLLGMITEEQFFNAKLNSDPYYYKLKFPSTSKQKYNLKF